LGWRVNTKRLERLWWRVLACVAGLHESHTLFCREAETERQAVTCGFVDPPSPEEMTALRSAPSLGAILAGEPDLTPLRRLFRRLDRQGEPDSRERNVLSLDQVTTVYDLLDAAKALGWLKPSTPV
jgi:hypothetical protein